MERVCFSPSSFFLALRFPLFLTLPFLLPFISSFPFSFPTSHSSPFPVHRLPKSFRLFLLPSRPSSYLFLFLPSYSSLHQLLKMVMDCVSVIYFFFYSTFPIVLLRWFIFCNDFYLYCFLKFTNIVVYDGHVSKCTHKRHTYIRT